jgi:hypothetical protein
MAAGGSTGPLRGAYFPLSFATQALATQSSGGSSAGSIIGCWTVPTGCTFNIVDIQASCSFSGSLGATGTTVGKIGVRAGTTAVTSEISLASGSAVSGTLTSAIVTVAAGTTIFATGFTASTLQMAALNPNVTITGFISTHPTSIFNNFGTFQSTSQPTTGP